MAAIAQFNKFSELSRRVAFSVGLFKTKERFLDILKIYEDKQGVSYRDVYPIFSSWVKTGDKKDNLSHYSDVFSALNLFEFDIKRCTFFPKYLLDVAYILRKMIGAEHHSIAADLIFLLSLIRSDGDLFLNAIDTDFNQEQLGKKLAEVSKYKFEKITTNIRGKNLKNEIFQALSYEVMKHSDKEGRRKPRSLRKLSSIPDYTFNDPSQDFLKKAVSSRKAWFNSIELLHSQIKTKILPFLKCNPEYSINSDICIWPINYELDRNKSLYESIIPSKKCRKSWGFLGDLTSALNEKKGSKMDESEFIEVLQKCWLINKSKKSLILSQELPILVFSFCYHLFCIIHKIQHIDIGEKLSSLTKGEKRVISVRTSLRPFSEGGISFLSHK